MDKRGNQVATVVAASLALGVGFGVGQGLVGGGKAPVVWAQGSVARNAEEQTTIRVAKQALPAVVSVSSGRGGGSGVIISSDGVVLTNAHVVGNRPEVQVWLATGTSLTGRVVGRDRSADIAVVKIPGKNYPKAAIADSDRLEVGQAAIAIGNPLGLDRTVTTGVVSAVSRRLRRDNADGFIQTDAAINPGNSGGPLLDSQGRVIGINTLILNGPAGGLGFAVPINVARSVADQLLTTGRVQRVLMGVSYTDVDPAMAAAFNLPVEQGLVVGEVPPGSPAYRAGIREQDIIVQVDDTPVRAGGDLRRALRARKPGDTVAVTLRRGERTRVVDVRLASMPTEIDPE